MNFVLKYKSFCESIVNLDTFNNANNKYDGNYLWTGADITSTPSNINKLNILDNDRVISDKDKPENIIKRKKIKRKKLKKEYELEKDFEYDFTTNWKTFLTKPGPGTAA
jgi:hypothetical protein